MRGLSGQAAPDPPEAEPGQGEGGGEEDRGFVALERPVAAGGLVADDLPEVKLADGGVTRLLGGRLALAGVSGRAGERMTCWSDALVGEDQSPGDIRGRRDLHLIVHPDEQLVDGCGIERRGDVDGRYEVRPYPYRHGDLDKGEHGEGDRHRGDGAADQHASGDTEGEGEGCVADGGDAAGGEQEGCEPVEAQASTVAGGESGRGVDGAGPPGEHQAEQPGGGHAGQADEADLDDGPAGAGDALVPGPPEGAGLEVAGA